MSAPELNPSQFAVDVRFIVQAVTPTDARAKVLEKIEDEANCYVTAVFDEDFNEVHP